jgi:phosphohistidine phosphatase
VKARREVSDVELYIIRHADALALGERGVTADKDRPLSEGGERQAAQIAQGLQRRGVKLDLVLTSPLVRARQTAEVLVRPENGVATELKTCEELAPGGRRKKLAKQLLAAGHNAVALVGHQPDLGEFAAWLIGSKKANLGLAKAGVAYIECSDLPRRGGGTLTWLVTPDWLA